MKSGNLNFPRSKIPHHKRIRSEVSAISKPSKADKKTNNKLLENFFMIGCDYPVPGGTPKVLYQYPLKTRADTNSIIKLSFPKGYSISSLDKTESGSAFYRLFYSTFQRDKNSYVFTLNSFGAQGEIGSFSILNNKKQLLYGCCVIEEEIILDTNNLVTVPRCYCILSYIPCFDLHFRVLYTLLSIKKAQKIEEMQYDELSYLSTDSSPRYQFILKEQYKMIKQYYKQRLSAHIKLSGLIEINHVFDRDLGLMDTEWACPVLFSIFTLDEVFMLLCAAMTEKSIVFVSENLDYLSSCVLGIQSLMKPFHWPYINVSILPDDFSYVLDSPVPFILGLPRLPPQFNSSDHIVCCLNEQVKVKGINLRENYATNLRKFLRGPYKLIERWNSSDAEQTVMRISKRIFREWLKLVKNIPVFDCQVTDAEVQFAKNHLLWNAGKNDWDFYYEFVNTQMFAQMVEDRSKLR